MATQAPTTTTSNGELVRRAFDMINRHDLDAMRGLWAEDLVERFPDRTCRGRDEVAAYFKETFAGVPDFHLEIVGIAEQGDDVFVQWRMTGTHEGTLLGIEPTGKRLEIDGIDHFVVRESL